MKLIELQVKYVSQINNTEKREHQIIVSGQNQNGLEFRLFTILSEIEWMDLMKELSKENKIGRRSKIQVNEVTTILKYQVL